ncbi:SHOCT domain-containing protein [Mucilaginibacter flavidus]|uniref:SHOCT domain-containing protein n=1 Tax=Mucilaginibacter flavidus TaxID=2949309 RepID=UPI0020922EA9|nr:SHOCT domain-containing protein [Mucilaginibacter flavidus]MCO5948628.1 SHOCT domain-containing protein [Mucilaginibacter flavidus]
MFYYNNFWGMDFIWWFVWIMMLIWIFALPYDIPGQRNKKNSPLDTLQQRFAAGEIGPDEYQERKKIIEIDYIQRS